MPRPGATSGSSSASLSSIPPSAKGDEGRPGRAADGQGVRAALVPGRQPRPGGSPASAADVQGLATRPAPPLRPGQRSHVHDRRLGEKLEEDSSHPAPSRDRLGRRYGSCRDHSSRSSSRSATLAAGLAAAAGLRLLPTVSGPAPGLGLLAVALPLRAGWRPRRDVSTWGPTSSCWPSPAASSRQPSLLRSWLARSLSTALQRLADAARGFAGGDLGSPGA